MLALRSIILVCVVLMETFKKFVLTFQRKKSRTSTFEHFHIFRLKMLKNLKISVAQD